MSALTPPMARTGSFTAAQTAAKSSAVTAPPGLRVYTSPSGYQFFAPPNWAQGTLTPGVSFDLELRSLDGQFIFVSKNVLTGPNIRSASDACTNSIRNQRNPPVGGGDGSVTVWSRWW